MSSRHPLWAWLFSMQILVMGLATVLATTNHLPSLLHALSHLDKVLHFVLYGGLSFLAIGLFRRAPWNRIVLVIAALATVEELSQGFSPNRSLDPYDLIANMAGILSFGLLADRLVQHRTATVRAQTERSAVPSR